jgi:WD40 repeat protein
MSRENFSGQPRVFLSYARKDGEEFATRLRKRLQAEESEITVWQDRAEMEGGVGWWKQIEGALDHVKFLVIVMTPEAVHSEMTRKEWRYARQSGVNVYPVKGCPDNELDYESLPNWMRKTHFFELDSEWETFVNYLKGDRQPSRIPFMAPDYPEGFVQRPREFEQLIAKLVDENRESPIAITTALQGAGGYGKTTLAIALCHDDRVMGAFDDGILWVTLGQSPNILGELTKLYEALTGDQPDFVDEIQAELKLREKLENRNCLLVIDDVWQMARLEPFLQGGKKTCARLITTRRLDLVFDAKRVQVDSMTPKESVALLAARLPGEHRPSDLQPLRYLSSRLMEWPLLLKLAAGVIRARLERGDTLEGALDYVNRAYERRGLTAFDPKDALKRNDAVAKSIEATLELLDKDERTRLSELAIFPEDIDVPLPIIELLWGFDDLDTEDIAKRLADFALLDLDLGKGLTRLHDEIRLHLGRAMLDEAALHARLVDRLGNPREIKDRYALRWLPWHLGKAGRDATRFALLLDFDWMMAKLRGTEIQSLIADYNYLPIHADLHIIPSILRQSAHILAGNPQELPGQMLGRLPEKLTQDIDSLRRQVTEQKEFPWLRPLRPSLATLDPCLIRTLQGHIGMVTAVAVTPDGGYIVSGSRDATLRVWDLVTGETKRTLLGHTGPITAVAVAPDGDYVISSSYDRTLRVWDLATGQLKSTLCGHIDRISALAVTPDARHIISGSHDRTLRVWDLATGQFESMLRGCRPGSIRAVAITPDGCHIVAGCTDAALRVWNVSTGQLQSTLRGHTNRVSAVAVIPGTCHVISGSHDRTLRVWDLATGQTKSTLRGHTGSIRAVAVTPDGRHVVSGSTDAMLRIWELATGQLKRTLRGHTDMIFAVAISIDGRCAVSGSHDGTVRLWDLPIGETERTLHGDTARVTAVAITPDGRLVVSGSADTLRVWDLSTGETERTLHGDSDRVNALVITPNGRCVVSGWDDGMLRVWGLETGESKRVFRGHTARVTAVAVTPDGQHVVSGSRDRTLRVWNLETGQNKRTLQGHTGSVRSLAVTPDGQHVVSGSRDTTLRVWHLETGQNKRTLQGHAGDVDAVAVTPNGRHVVSGSYDGTLRVWDLETGQNKRTLGGGPGLYRAVAVTPDGRYVVSGSTDAALRVWDLESGEQLVRFTLDGNVTTCVAAPDSRTIIAGDGFGRLHFLRLQGVNQ